MSTFSLIYYNAPNIPSYIERLNGVLGFWGQVRFVFDRIVASMRPLLDGGSAIIDMFGPVFGAIFGKFGDIIKTIDRLVVNNRANWEKFTTTLANVFKTIGDFLINMLELVDKALPALIVLGEVFMTVARAIMAVANALGSLGPLGALAGLAGLIVAKPMVKGGLAGMATGGGFIGGATGGRFAPRTGTGANAGYGRGAASTFRTARGAGYSARDAASLAMMQHSPRSAGGAVRGMGRSFGPGLALSLLATQVAPGAQGGVGTGAMIASMAPMLGAAGPAAAALGIGIGGYSIMKNATTGGGGALGGAMTGGAAGAAIGSVIPGIGTAAGAVLGAIAGGVYGYVQGRAQGEKKKVEKIVGEQTGQMFNTIGNAMAYGKTDSARNAIKNMQTRASELGKINEEYFQGMGLDPKTGELINRHDRGQRKQTAARLVAEGKITQSEADALAAAPGTYAEALQESADKTAKFLSGPLDRYDQMMGLLTKSTGKSEQEIKTLADQMGVNLYDDTVKFADAIEQLGLAVNLTKDQIIGASRDIVLESMSALETAFQSLNAPEVRREVVDNLRELLKAGTATDADIVKTVQEYTEQLMIEFPDQPLSVLDFVLKSFGPGGGLYEAGFAFEGFGSRLNDVLGPLLTQMESATLSKNAESMASTISGQLLTAGFAVDQQALASRFGTMSLDEQQSVLDAISSGKFAGFTTQGLGGSRGKLAQSGYNTAEEYISNVLLGGVGGAGVGVTRAQVSVANAATMSEEEITARADFFSAATAFFTNKPTWFGSSPSWFSAYPTWWNAEEKDTSTPRAGAVGDSATSRLGRTLGRHSYFNSMLSGKRTVTSSLRGWNLGSINSDHVTGNAYDLIGQNLGAYATLVNRSGGFAEFHGRGGGRHLHVVPGSTPVGDSTSARTAVATSMAPAQTSNSFSIVINGGSDSADVIAKKVIAEINRVQRSKQERA